MVSDSGGGVVKKIFSVAAYTFLFLEASYAVYSVVQYYTKKRNTIESRKPGHLWNTAIFFPEDGIKRTESRDQLFWYLKQTKRNLKICMYTITALPVRQIISDLHCQGVHIQIITMQKTAQLLLLKGYSMRVKATQSSDDLMHNKFVIVDNEALLTGSLNWTIEGFSGNDENVMITTQPRAVKSYLNQFENLWNISEASSLTPLV